MERRVLSQAISQSNIPYLTSSLPSFPPELSCSQIKCTIWDSRIYVHPSIITCGVDVVLHMTWLRVFTNYRIIIRTSRLLHGTKRFSLYFPFKETISN